MAQFAKANKISLDKQNELGRFRIEIEAKKGVLLEEMFPNGGNKAQSNNPTLKDEGITKNESSRARDISRTENIELIMDSIEDEGHVITPNKVDKIIKTLKRKEKKEQAEATKQSTPIPTDLYEVIYCDPPWRYNFSETESRAIENQYPTMDIEDIKSMAIPATDDCVLVMWATAPISPSKFLFEPRSPLIS